MSFLAAGLLLDQLKSHVPALFAPLDRISQFIVDATGTDYRTRTISQLLLASCLAFVWGAAFALLNRPRADDD